VNSTLENLAERVQAQARVPFTARDVERVLAALQGGEDIWRIIEQASTPFIGTCSVLREMEKQGWVEVGEGWVRLTEQGRVACQQLGISEIPELSCPRCRGRGLELSAVPPGAARFHQLVQGRPEASQEYDQGYITEESALARVGMMWRRGDLTGKEILFVGDDDLVCLAAAASGLPRRVVMVDIDRRLVEFVRDVAEREGLRVEAVRHDLRDPLPRALRRRFHTFACDPTESLRGFVAFARRGISALRGEGCAGYFGLTRSEASLAKWRAIQEELLSLGAAITDLIQDFHSYVNWPYLSTMRGWGHLPARRVPGPTETWYRSALVRIELVEVRPVPEDVMVGDIFEDDEAATT